VGRGGDVSSRPASEIRFHLGGAQSLRISLPALRTISAYRQRLPCMREAGGQLFGTVSEDEVLIVEASKPARRDERGRYHFRSHPETARAAIASAHAKNLLFLGEWHTHAERTPRPSHSDWDAMAQITKRSKLNTSRLILLIQGIDNLAAFILPSSASWVAFEALVPLAVDCPDRGDPSEADTSKRPRV
jgi:integrative and conjugative element protein (TIGR02256 family)